jgi:hypothetical protein
MHTYIHARKRTYNKYNHTCTHAYSHAYMHIHTYINTYIWAAAWLAGLWSLGDWPPVSGLVSWAWSFGRLVSGPLAGWSLVSASGWLVSGLCDFGWLVSGWLVL